MSHRNEDMSFKEMLKSINRRLDLLENSGAKAKLNDIRLGEVTIGTDRQSGKVKVVSELDGHATLLGKDEDAKWSYSGNVVYGTNNDSPPHVMSESLTATEIVVSLRDAISDAIPVSVTFHSVTNDGVSSGNIVVNATLPAYKNVYVTPVNVPCGRNSIIYCSLLPFTPVSIPKDLSVFVRFGAPIPTAHPFNPTGL